MFEAVVEQAKTSSEVGTPTFEIDGQLFTLSDTPVIRGQRRGAGTERSAQRRDRKGHVAGDSPRAAKSSTSRGQPRDKTQTPYLKQAKLDAEVERLQKLSQAASSGNTAALDELRVELDRCPHIWRHLADLQYDIECKMADQIAKNDPLKLEAFRKRVSELRYELTKDSDSLITKMAASRFVDCWNFAQFVELKLLTSELPEQWTKLLVQAERRTATSLRALIHARKAESQERASQSSIPK